MAEKINEESYSDEELVELTLTDREVFAILIRRYEPRLFRYIKRISGLSIEDTEEVLQDTFISVYKNLQGFDKDKKFSTWIYRIAHNTTISAVRKRKVRQKYQASDFSEELLNLISSEEDIALATNQKMESAEVHQILDSLKREHKEILILYYLEQLGYSEISDVLRISIGTVGSRLVRAKKAFAEKYKRLINEKQ